MIKAVCKTSSGKSIGNKRAAGDTNEKRPAKRLKDTPTKSELIRSLFTPPHKGTSEERLPDRLWSIDPDEVFRFMDLPGGKKHGNWSPYNTDSIRTAKSYL